MGEEKKSGEVHKEQMLRPSDTDPIRNRIDSACDIEEIGDENETCPKKGWRLEVEP
jgi:hypothetical protein